VALASGSSLREASSGGSRTADHECSSRTDAGGQGAQALAERRAIERFPVAWDGMGAFGDDEDVVGGQ
jgi:hypothetical protein